MYEITDNPDELAAHLATMRGLVVFDGCTSAGKSTLAGDMAARFGCDVINVDDFVRKKRGVYINSLRIEALSARVQKSLKRSPLVLLDAVCARAVVERVGAKATAVVYIMRLNQAGLPGDFQMVDADEDGVPADCPYFSELDTEILHYHATYRPITNADVVYRRTE